MLAPKLDEFLVVAVLGSAVVDHFHVCNQTAQNTMRTGSCSCSPKTFQHTPTFHRRCERVPISACGDLRMRAAALTSSSDEAPEPAALRPFIVPGEARLRFRLRLLANTRSRFLNFILGPTLGALLGARQSTGLLLALLDRRSIACAAAACIEFQGCLRGAFAQL